MKIVFNTNTEAFYKNGTINEMIRILDKIKEELTTGYEHGIISDIDNNEIGYWIFSRKEEEINE